MLPERPRDTAAERWPHPLDAPVGSRARVAAVELPAPPEVPTRADAPDEPSADRAARFGFVITPDGQYVEAHRAGAPRRPPSLPRFDVRWLPSDDPVGEADRQRLRAAAAAECARKLGPRTGGPRAP